MINTKYLIFLLSMVMMGCTELAPTEITPSSEPATKQLGDPAVVNTKDSSEKSLLQLNGSANCYSAGSLGFRINTASGFNCNEYLQAAFLDNEVNLSTGQPTSGANTSDWGNYPIEANLISTSQDFIRVCNFSDADGISHLPYSEDHVALIIRNTNGSFKEYTYGITSRNGIYRSWTPNHNPGTTPCDYEYIAAIPDVKINGPVKSGNTYQFTFDKGGNNFILNESNRWSWDTSKFTKVWSNYQTLILEPIGCITGSYTVSATVNTSATNGSSCNMGVRGVSNATKFTKTKTKNFTTTNSCSGTVNGNSLYTFNTVPGGTSNVTVDACQMTWVRTFGSASYSTSNNGKNMSFTLYSGTVTFQAYGSGCNNTYTFAAY